MNAFLFLKAAPVILAIISMGGCANYQPKPITAEAIERELTLPPNETLELRARQLRHPILDSIQMTFSEGISPTQAAVLAVLVNPTLRADRNRYALAQIQLVQAGILPNPQLDLEATPVTGGNTQGTQTGTNIGLSWEFTALISREAKMASASSAAESVRLDVAWQEWLVAQAAKTAVYDLIAIEAALGAATEVDDRLAENAATIKQAVDRNQKTILDLAAADAASLDAHAIVLGLRRDLARQKHLLNRTIGLPSHTELKLRKEISLPSHLQVPSEDSLLHDLENRRFDMLGLRKGYDSQDSTLRAAILSQFPKITFGLSRAADTTNVQTFGVGLSIELPVFDRRQAVIATETATRQKLFDEYTSRVFAARADISTNISDIEAFNQQIAAAETALPRLERLVQTYRDAIGRGNVDVLSFYTAQNNLSQKRIDLIKLKQQLVQSAIALEIATGQRLLDDASDSPHGPKVPQTQKIREDAK